MTEWRESIGENAKKAIKDNVRQAVQNELVDISATKFSQLNPEVFGIIMDRPKGSSRLNYMDLMPDNIVFGREKRSHNNPTTEKSLDADMKRAEDAVTEFASRLKGKGKVDLTSEPVSLIFSTRAESDFLNAINEALSQNNKIDVNALNQYLGRR